jgi:hypothetical protein
MLESFIGSQTTIKVLLLKTQGFPDLILNKFRLTCKYKLSACYPAFLKAKLTTQAPSPIGVASKIASTN